jgi:hypothetical protein
LVFDPIVFRPFFDGATTGLLTKYQVFAYVGVILAVFTLALWLILGQRIKSWAGLVTGVFYTSAIFACGAGIILIPFSFIGLLFFGMGVFGLIPFLTAFAFFRNGYRALCLARQTTSRNSLVGLITLGIIIIVAIPLYTQWQTAQIVPQSVQQILEDDTEAVEKAEQRLDYLRIVFPEYVNWRTTNIVRWPVQQAFGDGLSKNSGDIQRFQHVDWCITCYDGIVMNYAREEDQTRQHLLSSIYKDITGSEIEDRLLVIND